MARRIFSAVSFRVFPIFGFLFFVCHCSIGAEDQTLKPVFSGFDPGFDPVTGRV